MRCTDPLAPEFFHSVRYSIGDTPVRFNDYSALPRPTHNVAILTAGHAILWQGEREVLFREGDILFIPKYTRYMAEWHRDSERGCHFQTIHFDYPWQNDPLSGKTIPLQILPLSLTEEIREDVLWLHLHQYDRGVEAYAAMSRFFGLCHRLFGQFEWIPSAGKNSVRPALVWLESHYRERIRVDDLAQMCCLSESRFFACFRQVTGVAPIRYKNLLCIQHAMYALAADPHRSIEALSAEFGFDSPVYFRRVFKSITGQTPTEYRDTQCPLSDRSDSAGSR